MNTAGIMQAGFLALREPAVSVRQTFRDYTKGKGNERQITLI